MCPMYQAMCSGGCEALHTLTEWRSAGDPHWLPLRGRVPQRGLWCMGTHGIVPIEETAGIRATPAGFTLIEAMGDGHCGLTSTS